MELKKTSKNLTASQIEAVFDKYDKNRDGRLEFSEFRDMMSNHKRASFDERGAAAAEERKAATAELKRRPSVAP